MICVGMHCHFHTIIIMITYIRIPLYKLYPVNKILVFFLDLLCVSVVVFVINLQCTLGRLLLLL